MVIPIPFTLVQEMRAAIPEMGIRRWRWVLRLRLFGLWAVRQMQQVHPPGSPWRDIHASGFGVWLDHWWWGEEHFWWDGPHCLWGYGFVRVTRSDDTCEKCWPESER